VEKEVPRTVQLIGLRFEWSVPHDPILPLLFACELLGVAVRPVRVWIDSAGPHELPCGQ
jgi:hypothetical protein